MQEEHMDGALGGDAPRGCSVGHTAVSAGAEPRSSAFPIVLGAAVCLLMTQRRNPSLQMLPCGCFTRRGL